MHCFTFTFIYILFITLVFFCMWRGHPSEWLKKRDSHRLCELSYLEVGLGSQSIHMEFDVSAAAYTLLVRDSARCKQFFNQLTGKCPPSLISIYVYAPSCKYRAHMWNLNLNSNLSTFQALLFLFLWCKNKWIIYMTIYVCVPWDRQTVFILSELLTMACYMFLCSTWVCESFYLTVYRINLEIKF